MWPSAKARRGRALKPKIKIFFKKKQIYFIINEIK